MLSSDPHATGAVAMAATDGFRKDAVAGEPREPTLVYRSKRRWVRTDMTVDGRRQEQLLERKGKQVQVEKQERKAVEPKADSKEDPVPEEETAKEVKPKFKHSRKQSHARPAASDRVVETRPERRLEPRIEPKAEVKEEPPSETESEEEVQKTRRKRRKLQQQQQQKGSKDSKVKSEEDPEEDRTKSEQGDEENLEDEDGDDDDARRCKRSDGKSWRCAKPLHRDGWCVYHFQYYEAKRLKQPLPAAPKRQKKTKIQRGKRNRDVADVEDEVDRVEAKKRRVIAVAAPEQKGRAGKGQQRKGTSEAVAAKGNRSSPTERAAKRLKVRKDSAVDKVEDSDEKMSSRSRSSDSEEAEPAVDGKAGAGNRGRKVCNPNRCHQCWRLGIVIACGTCVNDAVHRRYCLSCIDKWYPNLKRSDVAEKCPHCRGFCNCKTCLRKARPLVEEKQTGKVEHLHYLLRKVLPSLVHLYEEQSEELNVERELRGDLAYEVETTPMSVQERMYCNRCKTSIVDYYRTCTGCEYDLCLFCCREMRQRRKEKDEATERVGSAQSTKEASAPVDSEEGDFGGMGGSLRAEVGESVNPAEAAKNQKESRAAPAVVDGEVTGCAAAVKEEENDVSAANEEPGFSSTVDEGLCPSAAMEGEGSRASAVEEENVPCLSAAKEGSVGTSADVCPIPAGEGGEGEVTNVDEVQEAAGLTYASPWEANADGAVSCPSVPAGEGGEGEVTNADELQEAAGLILSAAMEGEESRASAVDEENGPCLSAAKEGIAGTLADVCRFVPPGEGSEGEVTNTDELQEADGPTPSVGMEGEESLASAVEEEDGPCLSAAKEGIAGTLADVSPSVPAGEGNEGEVTNTDELQGAAGLTPSVGMEEEESRASAEEEETGPCLSAAKEGSAGTLADACPSVPAGEGGEGEVTNADELQEAAGLTYTSPWEANADGAVACPSVPAGEGGEGEVRNTGELQEAAGLIPSAAMEEEKPRASAVKEESGPYLSTAKETSAGTSADLCPSVPAVAVEGGEGEVTNAIQLQEAAGLTYVSPREGNVDGADACPSVPTGEGGEREVTNADELREPAGLTPSAAMEGEEFRASALAEEEENEPCLSGAKESSARTFADLCPSVPAAEGGEGEVTNVDELQEAAGLTYTSPREGNADEAVACLSVPAGEGGDGEVTNAGELPEATGLTFASPWEANADGAIVCAPKDWGGCGSGSLCLRSLQGPNTLKQVVADVERILSSTLGDEEDPSACMFCSPNSTSAKSNLLLAAHRDVEGDNHLYCPNVQELENGESLLHFQQHWSRGQPVIVKNVIDLGTGLSWEPMVMWRAVREKSKKKKQVDTLTVKAIECLSGCEVEIDIKQFFEKYEEHRAVNNGKPPADMYKLKDWPPSSSFSERLPRHHSEFLLCLPFKHYTHPEMGVLNLATKFPKGALRPDLGPKTYIAYGVREEMGTGNSVTKLHCDMSDAVNVLMHSKGSRTGKSPKPQGGSGEKVYKEPKKKQPSDLETSGGALTGTSDEVNVLMHSKGSRTWKSPIPQGDPGEKVYKEPKKKQPSDLETSGGALTDVSDAVTVLVPTKGSRTGKSPKLQGGAGEKLSKELKPKQPSDVQTSGGALWDIFRREDVGKLQEYILNHWTEFFDSNKPEEGITHPVHDQLFYLNEEHKLRLKAELGIEAWTFEQHVGEAVFIPAGCPHQVRNLQSCIKVAMDFVSPENVEQCVKLTEEFRMLPNSHPSKEDKLEVRKMVFQAAKLAVQDLERNPDEMPKKAPVKGRTSEEMPKKASSGSRRRKGVPQGAKRL